MLLRLGGRPLPRLLLLLPRGRRRRLLGVVGLSVALLLLILGRGRILLLLLAVLRRWCPAAAVLLLHGRAIRLLRRRRRRVGLRTRWEGDVAADEVHACCRKTQQMSMLPATAMKAGRQDYHAHLVLRVLLAVLLLRGGLVVAALHNWAGQCRWQTGQHAATQMLAGCA